MSPTTTAFLLLSVAAAIAHGQPINDQQQQQQQPGQTLAQQSCGKRLTETLKFLCQGHYANLGPHQPTEDSPFPHSSVVEKCCLQPCMVQDLMVYCSKQQQERILRGGSGSYHRKGTQISPTDVRSVVDDPTPYVLDLVIGFYDTRTGKFVDRSFREVIDGQRWTKALTQTLRPPLGLPRTISSFTRSEEVGGMGMREGGGGGGRGGCDSEGRGQGCWEKESAVPISFVIQHGGNERSFV